MKAGLNYRGGRLLALRKRGSAGKTTSSDDCFRWMMGAALVGRQGEAMCGPRY